MLPSRLDIFCDPETHSPLVPAENGLSEPRSGHLFRLRDGIPVFLDEVSGANRKYQGMYDRIAPGYDLAERLYRFVTRKPDYRLAYMGELEIAPGSRVLEVSVGTGANLRYLPDGIDFFGLDLSWGMLRRCARNLERWGRTAQLCQGVGERLPFRDDAFDCVYHVGGINFFNDPGAAIREMIRVAKPGTKIVILDETEKIVREHYQRNPMTAGFFEAGTENVRCPIDLVPAEMEEVRAREIYDGKLYCLTFRTPVVLRQDAGVGTLAAQREGWIGGE